MLFFGPYTTLVSFLAIFNFNIVQSSGGRCVVPMSASGQLSTGQWLMSRACSIGR
jgi:hypothetical protein